MNESLEIAMAVIGTITIVCLITTFPFLIIQAISYAICNGYYQARGKYEKRLWSDG